MSAGASSSTQGSAVAGTGRMAKSTHATRSSVRCRLFLLCVIDIANVSHEGAASTRAVGRERQREGGSPDHPWKSRLVYAGDNLIVLKIAGLTTQINAFLAVQ